MPPDGVLDLGVLVTRPHRTPLYRSFLSFFEHSGQHVLRDAFLPESGFDSHGPDRSILTSPPSEHGVSLKRYSLHHIKGFPSRWRFAGGR